VLKPTKKATNDQTKNVFEQAEKHPKAKQKFHEENLTRIKLAQVIHRERIAQNLQNLKLIWLKTS
jgi:hypothetical protein